MRIVPVTLRHGGLLLAEAWVGGVRFKAVIATGAERTLGNLVLLAALDLARAREVAAATALLIGMDLIGTVRRLSIDYRCRDVQVMPWPHAAEPGS